MKNTTQTDAARDAGQTDGLYLAIIENKLSDGSKVYAVRVGENGGMVFLEIDCTSFRKAVRMQASFQRAIRANTNVSVEAR
jgi:hypothetical protein